MPEKLNLVIFSKNVEYIVKYYLQHFADVACAENLVNDGELMRVVGREIRGEDAVLGAPAPEELAGGAGCVSAHSKRRWKKKDERRTFSFWK